MKGKMKNKEKKFVSFQEGMDKFGKEFHQIFETHLNYFMDILCYFTKPHIFSFDIVGFNTWAERKGYRVERDGSLSDWTEKTYGKEARNLIKRIINGILEGGDKK